MAGLWYPYADFSDAQRRLGAFADATIGPQCGISYSDGISIGVVRQPSGTADSWLWLNVLRQHVAAPPPPPPKPRGNWGKLKAWFWHAMEISGEAQLQQSQAELAEGQAVDDAIEKHIWLPVHEFLIRHKLLADGVGVALDVVGVVAGIVFIVAAFPEIAGGAAVIGGLGIVTGLSAAAGSAVLLGIDGAVFGLEVSGREGRAEELENNKTVQWMRIGATAMLLPDVAVGGARALSEIGKLGNEGRDAVAGEAEALRNAQTARKRVAKIANPNKHPGPVSRRMRKVKAFERAAEAQAKAVEEAHNRIRFTALKDLGWCLGQHWAVPDCLWVHRLLWCFRRNSASATSSYARLWRPQAECPRTSNLRCGSVAIKGCKTNDTSNTCSRAIVAGSAVRLLSARHIPRLCWARDAGGRCALFHFGMRGAHHPEWHVDVA